MSIEEIMAIITPILSGTCGVTFAGIIFKIFYKRVIKICKDAMLDNKKIAAELEATRESLADLRLKTGFIVEDVKERKHEKQKQK